LKSSKLESCNFAYISNIRQNLTELKREEVEKFLAISQDTKAFVIGGEGRSWAAADAGMKNIRGKRVITMDDIDLPEDELDKSLPALKRECGKIVLLIVSGSGTTTSPVHMAEQFAKYIERRRNNRDLKICVLTSYPESILGKLGQKYGVTLVLKGREAKEYSPTDHGLLNDEFEMAALLFFHILKEAINKKKDFLYIIDQLDKMTKKIDGLLHVFAKDPRFIGLSQAGTTRATITCGGKSNGSRKVTKMAVIRGRHVKKAVGDNFLAADDSSTQLRRGDIFIGISRHGENPSVIKWIEGFKKRGVLIYCIVGQESTLSRETISFNLKIISKRFYIVALFLLSYLMILMVEEFRRQGVPVPEEMLREFHSKTE